MVNSDLTEDGMFMAKKDPVPPAALRMHGL